MDDDAGRFAAPAMSVCARASVHTDTGGRRRRDLCTGRTRGPRESVAVVIATFAPCSGSMAFGWRISSRRGLAAAARRASAGTRGLPPPRAAAGVAVASPRPGPNHMPGGLHPRGSTRMDDVRAPGRTVCLITPSHLGSPPAASQLDLWALLR